MESGRVRSLRLLRERRRRPLGRAAAWCATAALGAGAYAALGAGGYAALVASAAAAQSVAATVDRNEVTLEEQMLLSVRVEGANVRPRLPGLPDFKVLERGTSRQMSIVNGQVSSSISYSYVLVPQRAGRFTVGPATIEVGGQTFASQPFEVAVLEATSTPSQSRDYFLTTQVSDPSPYVGQEVIFTWRFFRRVQLTDARLQPLQFGELVAEDLGEVREYSATHQGVEYVVSELRKALFAQRPGRLTVPGSELTIGVPVRRARGRSLFDDVFGAVEAETRFVRSPPIALDVRPLPPPPPGFSGLVGAFDIAAGQSKKTLAVGESATLEITVSGAGNAQQIALPPMPELAEFKVYDDQPTTSLERTLQGLKGKRTFRKALVPTTAGVLTIPSLALVYFDQAATDYRTASTRELSLEAASAGAAEDLRLTESVAPTTGKVAVRVLADDILPVVRDPRALRGQELEGVGGVLWGLGWFLPAAGYLGFVWQQRRRQRYAADRGLLRRQRALRQALSELGQVGQRPAGERPLRVSRLLRAYIGDRLGCEGAALTPGEAQARLLAAGADDGLARRRADKLERLEAAQFSGRAGGEAVPVLGIGALLHQIEAGLKAAAKEKRS